MSQSRRIDTSASKTALGNNPFAVLDDVGALPPPVSPRSQYATSANEATKKAKTLLRVRREKKGRGGKSVCTITGISAIHACDASAILSTLKTRLACGGSLESDTLVIQCADTERVITMLSSLGYKSIRSGG